MRQAYAVSTSELLRRWRAEPNPVTACVIRDIIGDRIDRHEVDRLKRVAEYAKEQTT